MLMWVMSYSTGWSQETFLLILKRYGGVIVTLPVSSIQPRNRDTFSRRDHLYPSLAALGSICHALCRIEVESWFACRVCSEENQFIGYFASKALLGVNILRRRWHCSDVSRFEHTL